MVSLHTPPSKPIYRIGTPDTESLCLDCKNACTEPITVASGSDTFGILNQYPSGPSHHGSYQIGISDNQGTRPNMEDTYGFIFDFDAVRGQGYFGIFDGHGNKLAAEYCGAEFHKYLLRIIHNQPDAPILEVLNSTYSIVDKKLSELSKSSELMGSSGCTAATAFLRLEDIVGHQPFLETPTSCSPKSVPVTPPSASTKRVLYCANVGDARAVLSRSGVARRLTYDHKASDENERIRVKEAGGFVIGGRVLGYLNIARSLGDHISSDESSMKKFIIGDPYTSRTELTEDDDLLIIASDGLWDVVKDQEAVDLIRNVEDAQAASRMLLDYAIKNQTKDNATVMVVRFKKS